MREKLIKILRQPIFPYEYADPTEVVADYLLDNDVVPVVRCKGCVYYHGVTGKDSGKPCGYGWCEHRNGTKRVCYDEEFCSCGERRTDV